MPSIAYVLGGMTFAAKAHVERHARSVLRAGPIPRRLHADDAAFVADLLDLHARAEEKRGVGVRSLWVKANLYGEPGFFVERIDGTWEDFSYKKCLTPMTRRTLAHRAMRQAIAEQVYAFKVAAFAAGPVTCALSGLPLAWDEAHIDHAYPLTFVALASAFLTERGETVDDVPIGPHPSGQGVVIDDPAWRAAWAAYHQAYAQLRCLEAELNIERGARP